MKKLLTALLIGMVSPILVPCILLGQFIGWFHWPYLNIIFWPLSIPTLIIVWAFLRLNKDKFRITLLEFLRLELLESISGFSDE